MKRLIILSLLGSMFACSTADKQLYVTAVETAEDALYGDNKTFQMQPEKVDALVEAYTNYAQTFPDDTMSADYLLKTADLHRFSRKSNEALEMYQRIYDNYPDFKKRAK